MKNTYNFKFKNKAWIIFSTIVFMSLLLVSNVSVIASLLWYWSDTDYSNPVSSFSWSVQVWSWETQNSAVQYTLTNAVSVTNGSISIVIPNTSQVTNSIWTSFDINNVTSSVLWVLPLTLPTNEEDVGKINFWISGMKLNFSKPVKIQIPVSTSASTVRIKAKHFWIDWYQTFALTDSISSSCSNWIASPSSNIAPVVGWIATFYTCSASQFVAVVDKVVSSSSSGWGGGGWWLRRDNCPSWDFSPSYYDNKCGTSPVTFTNTQLWVNELTWTDELTWTNNLWNWVLQLQTVSYRWVNVVVYQWYKLAKETNKVSKNIIENQKLTLEQKKYFVNRVNEFLVAKYNLDIAQDDIVNKKYKYNKQFVLLLWSTEKLKKELKN